MAFSVIKRPAAIRDIEQCFVDIAENNLDIAVTFLVAVEETLDRLSEFPFIGRSTQFRNKELPDVKMWPVKGFDRYLIFYTLDASKVEVIRVVHGARDIEELFT